MDDDDDIDFEIDEKICANADIIVASSFAANSAVLQDGYYNVPCFLLPSPKPGSYWFELLKKRYRLIGWLLVEQKEDRFFLAPLYE